MTKKRKHYTICPNCGAESVYCINCGWQSTGSTPFSDWLREQDELDSSRGFITTDIDYFWRNYKTGEHMLIEEKRYMGTMDFSQEQSLKLMSDFLSKTPKYYGLYLIQFEKNSPEDGEIFVNHQKVTVNELIKLLQFEKEVNNE